jgi:SAM-dependent methyltransferase
MASDPSYAGKSAYQGDVARSYERDRAEEPVWRQEQAWMEAWSAQVHPGEAVLDIPAGTGRFVGIFRSRGARVHAVDVSEDMLAELRRRHPPEPGALVVERQDAEALSYPDATFDYVICWRLLHLLPADAARRVLGELARVCRKEIIVEVFGVERGGPIVAWARALRRSWRSRRGEPADDSPWSHITNYVHRESTLLAVFAQCSLRVDRVETLADYRGAPARVYFLRRREAGQR